MRRPNTSGVSQPIWLDVTSVTYVSADFLTCTFQVRVMIWRVQQYQRSFIFLGWMHWQLTFNSLLTSSSPGDAITIYGAVGPTYGLYNAKSRRANKYPQCCEAETLSPAVSIYAVNVGSGQHVVRLNSAQTGQAFMIDFAVVSTATSTSKQADFLLFICCD